jgi:hypothetical protein
VLKVENLSTSLYSMGLCLVESESAVVINAAVTEVEKCKDGLKTIT